MTGHETGCNAEHGSEICTCGYQEFRQLTVDRKRCAINEARKAICDAAIAYVEDCNLKFEEELGEAVAKLRSIELKNEK